MGPLGSVGYRDFIHRPSLMYLMRLLRWLIKSQKEVHLSRIFKVHSMSADPCWSHEFSSPPIHVTEAEDEQKKRQTLFRVITLPFAQQS